MYRGCATLCLEPIVCAIGSSFLKTITNSNQLTVLKIV